jgi:hypothetical protein
MPSRDQPFSDRASVFWGHHRLPIEQLAGIPGQRQLGLQRRDAFVGCGQLVGLHARSAFDDAGVDQCLAFPPKKSGLSDPCLGRDRPLCQPGLRHLPADN